MNTLQLSGLLFRRFNTSRARNGGRLAPVLRQCANYGSLRGYRRKIGLWVKEQSVQVAEACTRQFEFIAAQRIRRSVQIFHLYTRIWDEVALKEFIKSWRHRVARNTKRFLMSTVGVTMYNWERERISDEEVNSYNQEIEQIYKLKDSTVVCGKCRLRIIVDSERPGVKYCRCQGLKPMATANRDPNGWQPFIELQDMLIWRRPEPDCGGLFAYKVYGSFPDVTAEDFLQVHIDIEYRKQWDPTARELQIIDTDPKSQSCHDHSADIIYWEMIWPRLFSNRDYVYQRRWVVDADKGTIVIISKVTEHPNAPIRPGIYRVTTYWSYMVIRPYTEFHKPGIEFGLTYFDDPGVNIPSTVTAWVAVSGLPDFLTRMRQASNDFQKYKLRQGTLSPKTEYIGFNEEVSSQQNVTSGGRSNADSTKIGLADKVQEQVKNVTDQKEALKLDAQQDTGIAHNKVTECASTSTSDGHLPHYSFLARFFA